MLTHKTPVLDLLTADRETHARQRRLISHAFSEKALREQESILNLYASKLCEQLEGYSRHGPVDMKDWYTFSSRSSNIDVAMALSHGDIEECAARRPKS